MIPLHQSHASDLSWQNLYEVPKGETWEIKWSNPYDSTRSGYDIRLIAGKYSVQDPTLITPTRTARNEVHVVASGRKEDAILYMHEGAVFQIGDKPLKFRVRVTNGSVQNAIQTSAKRRSTESTQITQMIDPLMLIQGLLVLVGVGWLLMYLTRKPKDKIDTINKKSSVNNVDTSIDTNTSSHNSQPHQKISTNDNQINLEKNRYRSKDISVSTHTTSSKTKSRIKDFQSFDTRTNEHKESVSMRIEKVNQLLQEGLISEDEASQQRSRIMNEI